ncbi:hypothetical protein OAF38_01260 [bacterium]|nr:hypothetical protein [Rubripirellula sp.]MDB4730388.1 hypothetical protein [bacterium]
MNQLFDHREAGKHSGRNCVNVPTNQQRVYGFMMGTDMCEWYSQHQNAAKSYFLAWNSFNHPHAVAIIEASIPGHRNHLHTQQLTADGQALIH